MNYDIYDRFTVEHSPLRRMTLTTKIYCSRLYRVSETRCLSCIKRKGKTIEKI
jgi:hypothetical protein